MLLDDIFDKDASRGADHQIGQREWLRANFYYGYEPEYLNLLAMNHDYALFRVERGEVQPMENKDAEKKYTDIGQVLRDFSRYTELYENDGDPGPTCVGEV